jgi:rhomboid protease GluP
MENQDPLQHDPFFNDRQPTLSAQDTIIYQRIAHRKPYAIYALIAINVLIFIAMVATGVHIMSPKSIDLIQWGAMTNVESFGDDKWRLFTSMFLHIGIIHLAMNMYVLWQAYPLENIIGTRLFVPVYIISGLFGSLASMFYHTEPYVGAGASGAIFGVYGVFFALLLTKLIPTEYRNLMLKDIGIFIGFNLLYGTSAGVDNAAHIGGLVSGFVIGFMILPFVKKGISKD